MKKLSTWFEIVLAVFFIALFAWVYFFVHPASPNPLASTVSVVPTVNTPSYTHALRIGKTDLHVAVADTDALRTLGLSFSKPLGLDEGMIFEFPNPMPVSFWMKDMRYPLDIIWISTDKKVVGYVENFQPNSYPKTVSPKVLVQYVLEVPAGFVHKNGITFGSIVSF
ncbi:MAG: DUF192 domain-containing protein [bacterium]